jgi:hypothetical protein
MPAWRREVEAVIARELGPAAPRAVTVSFVGRTPSADARRATIADAARGLAADATLIVVDHNRPRRRIAALAALVRMPRLPGGAPSARWRRQAHPTARELQAAGFRVERLRLVAGERVQVVFARKRPLAT